MTATQALWDPLPGDSAIITTQTSSVSLERALNRVPDRKNGGDCGWEVAGDIDRHRGETTWVTEVVHL